MATDQQKDQQNDETTEAPTRPYRFNKDTGIVGYTFEDGRKFRLGPVYYQTDAGRQTYAEKAGNSPQPLLLR